MLKDSTGGKLKVAMNGKGGHVVAAMMVMMAMIATMTKMVTVTMVVTFLWQCDGDLCDDSG